ncbi:MAG: phage portal protein [Chloroflexi bacterium]|nr:phage portal protein [Chloroflexota bacterium]
MFDKFAKLLQAPARATPRPPALTRLAVPHEPPPPLALAPGLVYQQSPWVYVAVNRIAEAAALVPLRVLRVQGEHTLEAVRHPLEILLDNPNPFLSRFELLEATIGMLELYGNAYWYLASGDDGRPAQIWPLRPDRVSIVPDAVRYIRGYVYEIDGQRIPLETSEVVHFKRWHPANDYYGLSALEAARLSVLTDKAMAEWNKNTFGLDNGVPAGIVSVKDMVSDADFERVKREWRASYGGPQRRTAFLRGSSIQWQNIGLSHTDLDFLKGRHANREEILNIFGLPLGLFSENATEANAKVGERLFIERTLWPKLVRLAQKITQEMLPFYPGRFIAVFDDIRPTDTQARLDEIRAAYPLLTINELRARYFALPPVAWGEQPAQASAVLAAAPPLPENAPETSAETPADAPPPDARKAALDELAQWERFALKRLGQAQGRPFAVRALPAELAFEVAAELQGAQTEDEARAVFKEARARLTEEAAA